QVLARRLAERLVGRGEVEHVVDDLEAHTEVVTEAGQCVERRLVDVAHHAADPTRRGEERGRLPLDRRRVRLLGAGHVAEVLQLEYLPAAQLTDRCREESGLPGAE